jgi:predicted RecB family nuclease
MLRGHNLRSSGWQAAEDLRKTADSVQNASLHHIKTFRPLQTLRPSRHTPDTLCKLTGHWRAQYSVIDTKLDRPGPVRHSGARAMHAVILHHTNGKQVTNINMLPMKYQAFNRS